MTAAKHDSSTSKARSSNTRNPKLTSKATSKVSETPTATGEAASESAVPTPIDTPPVEPAKVHAGTHAAPNGKQAEDRPSGSANGTSDGYKVIGTRPIRHDGTDKVTGHAIYGGDFRLPGMLYGKILRSPHAHAHIRSIDTTQAATYPGVRAVMTSADLPRIADKMADLGEGTFNFKWVSDNVLASDRALYKGHAVAAIAATSPHIAEEALKLIKVDYEELPAVLDAPSAMADGAPLLHEDMVTESLGKKATKKSNIATFFRHELGNIERGFAAADVVVERVFTTATVHQGYIEPHPAVALWNPDGRIEIWTSTQGAFGVRDQVAQVLDVPVSKIKVTPLEIGGGFGGKISIYVEPVAAILSKLTGKPVKIVMTRSEVFQGTGPTPGCWMRVKMGAKSDGRLTAAEADLRFEAGAYPGSAVGAGSVCIFASYDIPNGRIDAYDVVVNKPKSAAYRAPGSTQVAFATEQVMDELAQRLKIDPLDFRMKNAAKEGSRRIDGPVYPRIGSFEVLQAARNHPHYSAPLGGPNRGRGVAHGYWMNGGGQSACNISANADGTVTLIEGSTDIGGTRTSIAQQAAEVLGIPVLDVKPIVADTDSIGYTGVTGGSRTTFASGLAAIAAANDLIRQMRERAATIWEVKPAAVDFAAGTFSTGSGATAKSASFADLAGKLFQTGGTLTGRANIDAHGAGGAFATAIVDLEVDPETGKVQILRYTAIQDVGKAIHPAYVEGQMQGGAVQGIGWALHEGYFFDAKGGMLNPSLLDYKLPTALDVPMIDTVIVEVPNPSHPYGVRGVGEVPIVPPPAAIANAICRAIGKRLFDLPMTEVKILEATGVLV